MRARKLLTTAALAASLVAGGVIGAVSAASAPTAPAAKPGTVSERVILEALERHPGIRADDKLLARMTATSPRYIRDMRRCAVKFGGYKSLAMQAKHAACADRADSREWDRIGCTHKAVKALPASKRGKVCIYTPAKVRGIK